jgi:putative oxidoreductase
MAALGKLGEYRNFGLLVMRVGLGVMMMYHGYPKLFAGPETWAKLGGDMKHFGIAFSPAFWGFMAAATETIGGLLVVLGLWFRPICILMVINLSVAAAHHFYAGGGLNDAAHAIETGLAFFGLIFLGPGWFSVDKG